MLIVLYRYVIHDEFIRSTDHSYFKRWVLLAIADVPLRPELSKAGRSIFFGHTDEQLGIQYVHTHHVLEKVLWGSYNDD